jgi:hypothetical protein
MDPLKYVWRGRGGMPTESWAGIHQHFVGDWNVNCFPQILMFGSTPCGDAYLRPPLPRPVQWLFNEKYVKHTTKLRQKCRL